MEIGEKLRNLRVQKNLTQENTLVLVEMLYKL